VTWVSSVIASDNLTDPVIVQSQIGRDCHISLRLLAIYFTPRWVSFQLGKLLVFTPELIRGCQASNYAAALRLRVAVLISVFQG